MKSHLSARIIPICALLILLFGVLEPDPAEGFLEQFQDPKDGDFDLSYYLAEKKGFLPILVPITEPAVGYGAAFAGIFLHKSMAELQSEAEKNETGRRKPPSITVAGGMATENGTWGGFGGHFGVWADDRLRYMGGAGGASVNLKFYGIGDELGDDGLKYNLKGAGTVQELNARLGSSDFFLGGRYTFFKVKSRFDVDDDIPRVGKREFTSNNGGLGISLNYDTRDNIFTPDRGLNGKLRLIYYDKAFGGDFRYQLIEGFCIGYLPVRPRLVLGFRLEGKFSGGDVPFYALPFLDMRGVPLMKYQGKDVALLEAEARWNIYERWSMVGFAGAGKVSGNLNNLVNRPTVYTQGIGFRYLLARLFGLHAGVDIAHGPGQWAFYIQVGSAWARSL